LLPLDTLHFLNPEAYPTDNFEAIFRQLYRLVPYLDALKAKYMELSRKPSHKGGGDVRPVLPSGGDLSEKDKALLNRNAATAARAEVEAAMTILQRECDDAKLALQSTKTQTARVLAETRAPLDAEIDRLRSVIEAMGGTTRAVQSEVSALKAELALREEATRRVAAQAAKQDALSSERDEAFAKALAAEEAIAAEARKVATLNGLLAESDAAKRELSARAAALLEANLGLQAHVTRLSAQLATLGAEPVK
jgi:chromosome segregation ATPase